LGVREEKPHAKTLRRGGRQGNDGGCQSPFSVNSRFLRIAKQGKNREFGKLRIRAIAVETAEILGMQNVDVTQDSRLAALTGTAYAAPTANRNTSSGKAASASGNTIPSESVVVFAGNGHKYEVIVSSKNWSAARQDCEKRGGYLATITSAEEQQFIEDLLSKQGRDYYWLGGYYAGDKWQWVTGESFVYTNGVGQATGVERRGVSRLPPVGECKETIVSTSLCDIVKAIAPCT